jgi:hypothetical protein
MPKGPKGQKRPADVISNAVHVMRIATGEIEESGQWDDGKNKTAAQLGSKGGKARAKKLGVRRRKEIASNTSDNAFSDGTQSELATLSGDTTSGYTATLSIGISV